MHGELFVRAGAARPGRAEDTERVSRERERVRRTGPRGVGVVHIYLCPRTGLNAYSMQILRPYPRTPRVHYTPPHIRRPPVARPPAAEPIGRNRPPPVPLPAADGRGRVVNIARDPGSKSLLIHWLAKYVGGKKKKKTKREKIQMAMMVCGGGARVHHRRRRRRCRHILSSGMRAFEFFVCH